jgi:hypothetical protein
VRVPFCSQQSGYAGQLIDCERHGDGERLHSHSCIHTHCTNTTVAAFQKKSGQRVKASSAHTFLTQKLLPSLHGQSNCRFYRFNYTLMHRRGLVRA